MGAGGLNGELRENPGNYVDAILHYHLNGGQERTGSSRNQHQFSFHTSNRQEPTFPPSSSSTNSTSNPTRSRESDVDMVCYLCSANFNILKRKKNCPACRRDFCKECFKEGTTAIDSSLLNCLICRSLKAPHVYREFLQRIRTKDLCDYLLKKNIPFQDCKEKREIINLVLQSSPVQPEPHVFNRRGPSSQQSTAWTTTRTGNTNTSSRTRHSFTATNNTGSNTTGSNRSTTTTNASVPKPSAQTAVMRNIEDISSIDQIQSLSIKEIKRILITNCIDFKGCCEKNELLDKVSLLWKDKNSHKNSDEENEDQICKVCMDNVIDCVLLECGHMVTCMGCSKKVKECPICRQHVVRIVKVFKA